MMEACDIKTASCSEIKTFSDFPLSEKTLRGLAELDYKYPTDIQRESISYALAGRDVVGSAVTGSGKTLAFLIPVLEHLYLNKWSPMDGIGALIITPTRELAYQIFGVLQGVGKYHDFSAGLVIGGKNLKFERKRIDKCNIIICTPGRLLQHMDENPLFNTYNVKILVMDEADRCLDMGFENTINAIIENLQHERQTLIFSATQTQSVKDLARLNLQDAIYVGQKGFATSVPVLLQQSYTIVTLEDKITVLWSFIKNHLKQKCIVFLSSCKQVKYVYEIFCKLRPGTSLLALYGTLHQDRRISIYKDFVNKSNVVLFATDIASRGLDFPLVNWVVQLDCPEDVPQYIHRAGRSARNKARGESLLVLMPSELAMVDDLKEKGINISHIQIDSKKLFSPRVKIEAILAQNPELKACAKRAFLAYVKSVHNMKNKNIFNVQNLNFDQFAKSLGLAIAPRIRFLDNKIKKSATGNKKYNLTNTNNNFCNNSNSESDSDELFTVKRVDNIGHIPETKTSDDSKNVKCVTKVSQAKKILRKRLLINSKIKFGENGDEELDSDKELSTVLSGEGSDNIVSGINLRTSKKILSEKDKLNKKHYKENAKLKRKRIKKECQDFDETCSNDYDPTLESLPLPISKDSSSENNIYPESTNKAPRKLLKKSSSKKHKSLSSKLTLEDAETIAAEILS